MLVVAVGLVCLALGVLLGRAIAPAPVVVPEIAAAEPPPPPVVPESPARPWLRASFLPRATGLAEAVGAKGREDPTAAAFASMAMEGWALGVEDLRAALIKSSGLPPAIMDEACSVALSVVEAEQCSRS